MNSVKLDSLLPPVAPALMSFDVRNATYLRMEWLATTSANRYRVEITTEGYNNTFTTTSLSATFTLQPKTLYRVIVWAVDGLDPPRLGDALERLFGTPALGTLGCHGTRVYLFPLQCFLFDYKILYLVASL